MGKSSKYPAQDLGTRTARMPLWQRVGAALGLAGVLGACGGHPRNPSVFEILDVDRDDVVGAYWATPEEGVNVTYEYPINSGKTVEVNVKAAYYGIPQTGIFDDGKVHYSACASTAVVGGTSDVDIVTPHPRFQSVEVEWPKIGPWDWEIKFLGGQVVSTDETDELAEGAGAGDVARTTNCTEPRSVVRGAHFLAGDVQLLVPTENEGEFHRLGREPVDSYPTVFHEDDGAPLHVDHIRPPLRSMGLSRELSLTPLD